MGEDSKQTPKLKAGSAEYEFYATDLSQRYKKKKKKIVTTEKKAVMNAINFWNTITTVLLYALAACGAWALTNARIVKGLEELYRLFLIEVGIA